MTNLHTHARCGRPRPTGVPLSPVLRAPSPTVRFGVSSGYGSFRKLGSEAQRLRSSRTGTIAAFIAHRRPVPRPQPSSADWRRSGKVHRLFGWRTGERRRGGDRNAAALRAKRARRNSVGLTRVLLEQLIAACPDTLAGLRDRAMIALGYDTLCRRSELVGCAWRI